MKQSLSLFIAWRYLRFPEKDQSITFMMRMCFLGIFIGTFALMLTLIITNGFEKTIHEKMQGINAEIIINSFGNKFDYTNIKTALHQEFPHEIAAISGVCKGQAIVEHNNEHIVLYMKGIDPLEEHKVSSIAEKIIIKKNQQKKDPTSALLPLADNNSIIIGYKMAQLLQLKVGSKLTILIPHPNSKKNIGLTPHKVYVRGIFDVGLEEYDANLALCSLDFFNELYDCEGVDQLSLKLQEQTTSFQSIYQKYKNNWFQLASLSIQTLFKKIKQLFLPDNTTHNIIKKLRRFLPEMQIHHWQDLYPGLVSSLKLEKYVMFFVLALITLVASLNMIALLFMQIQQKRRDIAILKAMGMPNKHIRAIFLRTGLTISFLASISGLAAAGIAGYALQCYPFITLPDVYFISYLPARLDAEIFLVVFIATMLISFFATWIPAQRAQSLTIAQVLREE